MFRYGPRWSVLGLVLPLWSLFAAGSALAESVEEAVLREYVAAGDCPDSSVFTSHFASRTTRVRLVSVSSVARHGFAVALTHEGSRIVGRLEIRSRDGALSHREVAGEACAEVVSALAFVAALTADPTAQSIGAPLSNESRRVETAASAQIIDPMPTASTAVSTMPQPQKKLDGDPGESRRLEGMDGSRWELLGQLGALVGLLPDTNLYAALFLQLGLPRQSWGIPGLRLGLLGSQSRSVQVDPGSAQFQWVTAQLAICPAMVRFSDQWSMTPCAVGELGILRGASQGVTDPDEQTRWWRAAGGSLQLNWMASRRLFVQADATLRFPLARYEFVMVDDASFAHIHDVRAGSGGVGLGVGVRL